MKVTQDCLVAVSALRCNGAEAYIINNAATVWSITFLRINILCQQKHSFMLNYILIFFSSSYFICEKGLTVNLVNIIVSIAYLMLLLYFS